MAATTAAVEVEAGLAVVVELEGPPAGACWWLLVAGLLGRRDASAWSGEGAAVECIGMTA